MESKKDARRTSGRGIIKILDKGQVIFNKFSGGAGFREYEGDEFSRWENFSGRIFLF